MEQKLVKKGGRSFHKVVQRHFMRGRLFEDKVQKDFISNTKGDDMKKEIIVDYLGKADRKKGNFGRMDMFLDDSNNGYVVIYEIKATNWDAIKPKNRIRNLYRHGRQLHKYIDAYVHGENLNVVHGVIYPKPPTTENLKEFIEETAMLRYAFPVYWYNELIK